MKWSAEDAANVGETFALTERWRVEDVRGDLIRSRAFSVWCLSLSLEEEEKKIPLTFSRLERLDSREKKNTNGEVELDKTNRDEEVEEEKTALSWFNFVIIIFTFYTCTSQQLQSGWRAQTGLYTERRESTLSRQSCLKHNKNTQQVAAFQPLTKTQWRLLHNHFPTTWHLCIALHKS